MTTLLRTFAIAFIACGALDETPLAIQNHSTHTLTAIQLAGVAEQTFEPSLIVEPLASGRLAHARVACGRYDVRFGDERGRQCVLVNQPLCFEREPWTIDDVTLDTCRWR
jgi:hypothetical protein